MDNGNLSASDVALLNRDGNDWGNNSFMWIFALLILANGGLGWGNNNFANAIGYENLATSNEVQRGFDNQNAMANQREILSAVTNGTAQSVAATNQSFHDTLNVIQDKYSETQRDIAALAVGQANALAHQNQCCCDTLRAIDGVNFAQAQNTSAITAAIAQNRYEDALNTAAIQQIIVAEAQKTRDMYAGDRMADMQNQINQLQLQQAVAGVVRYPMSSVYSSGNNPFCNCGSCCG